MEEIINTHEIENLLEDFMRENPMGDSRDLAKYCFERGYKTCMEKNMAQSL